MSDFRPKKREAFSLRPIREGEHRPTIRTAMVPASRLRELPRAKSESMLLDPGTLLVFVPGNSKQLLISTLKLKQGARLNKSPLKLEVRRING